MNGRRHIEHHFLGDRHLLQYADLLAQRSGGVVAIGESDRLASPSWQGPRCDEHVHGVGSFTPLDSPRHVRPAGGPSLVVHREGCGYWRLGRSRPNAGMHGRSSLGTLHEQTSLRLVSDRCQICGKLPSAPSPSSLAAGSLLGQVTAHDASGVQKR